MQTDPVGYVDGPNLYTYVGNNPLNRVDPTGLFLEAMLEQLEQIPNLPNVTDYSSSKWAIAADAFITAIEAAITGGLGIVSVGGAISGVGGPVAFWSGIGAVYMGQDAYE